AVHQRVAQAVGDRGEVVDLQSGRVERRLGVRERRAGPDTRRVRVREDGAVGGDRYLLVVAEAAEVDHIIVEGDGKGGVGAGEPLRIDAVARAGQGVDPGGRHGQLEDATVAEPAGGGL